MSVPYPDPHSNPPRDPLSNELQSWKLSATLPPQFQEQVWKRIAAAHDRDLRPHPTWTGLVAWLDQLLPRPAVAASYFILLLTIGATTGYFRGQHESARIGGVLSLRYVQSVDPYQSAPHP